MDADYYNDISDQITDTYQAKVKRVIHSTLLYILAYIRVTYIQQGTAGLVALLVGYHPVIKYFGIYHVPVAASLWTRWKVFCVFGSGPFIGLIIAIIAYRVNSIIREFDTLWKVLALWISIHGTCLFFGYCITSSFGASNYLSPFYYGFAIISAWFYVDSVLMVPVTVFGIVTLIVFGLNVVIPFLNLCFSRPMAMNYRARRGFLVQVAVIPWLIGSIVCVFISLPPNPAMRDIMMNFTKNACMAFMMLGMLFKIDHIVGSIQVHSFDIFRRSFWIEVAACLVMILFIQQRFILYFIQWLKGLI